jgi:uncharacterized membrane protein
MVSEKERNREGKIVGWTLRVGAYAAVTLIVAGLVLMSVHAGTSDAVLRAGFLLLMFTPALRIMVAGVVFFRERDYKYVVVSLVVLAVVVTTSVLAITGRLPQLEK